MLGLTLYRAGGQIASRLSERWCSLQTRRPRFYSDIEGDVPTPILREVAQSPGVFRRARTDAARTFRADQLEMLQPIYEQQERQARRRLVKTNAQIRHTLLRRLGFSPDTVARAHPRVATAVAGRLAADDGAVAAFACLRLRAFI